jgi:hypothetical protein
MSQHWRLMAFILTLSLVFWGGIVLRGCDGGALGPTILEPGP